MIYRALVLPTGLNVNSEPVTLSIINITWRESATDQATGVVSFVASTPSSEQQIRLRGRAAMTGVVCRAAARARALEQRGGRLQRPGPDQPSIVALRRAPTRLMILLILVQQANT